MEIENLENEYLIKLQGGYKFDKDKPELIVPNILLKDKSFLIKAIKQKHYQYGAIYRRLFEMESNALLNVEILAYIDIFEDFKWYNIHHCISKSKTYNREHFLYCRLIETIFDTFQYKEMKQKILDKNKDRKGMGGRTPSDINIYGDIEEL